MCQSFLLKSFTGSKSCYSGDSSFLSIQKPFPKYPSSRNVPLGRFLEDGRVPLDKGEAERLIKRIVLGRKNRLFLGSDAAGHRAAAVYSLLLSCYRLEMDPWAYFRDVLPKLGDTRFPASRIAELLPEAWAQQQAQQR
ncbi:Transposase [Stigmatella aurantiaca DW4/3-1]|uniref:ISSfl3 OrfC n=1 Tax=Stigmatella aurantiaca (strain DW4/3-1) TaxID=378806 RepID=Q09DW2_STIAD|nr:transposase [Stigmatella aurantiaca]ADO75200.1 Transposase [Stigmatella aurantiaca DW4/3-1]EAU69838.1 ISSfl3 OrfC [Stigmatella aurantiaca DW4/3-1]